MKVYKNNKFKLKNNLNLFLKASIMELLKQKLLYK